MKQGTSLQNVLEKLKRQYEAKADYIAPTGALRVSDSAKSIILKKDGHDFAKMGMTDLFHRQIGTALNIPAKYYNAMRDEKPDLLATNINAWLETKNQAYMLRTMEYDGYRKARALLSPRYRRIDNIEVASTILPLFAGKGGMEVMSCAVTENKLYLKIVNHRLEKEVKKGDLVQAGVVISNSEVGLGAVSVQPLVYRLVCTNGMVVNALGERRNHVGRTAKTVEDFSVYSDETMKAEDKAFMLKLRDATMAALNEARFSQIIGKLQESTEAKITGKVQDVVELTGKTFDFTQQEQDNVLNYLIRGGDLSMYGLSNAITRASQDVESYDRATALEGFGWDVVNMTPSQWNKLNVA